MKISKTIGEIKNIIQTLKCSNKTIGFVPTMGALHEGHLSLVRKSVFDNDQTIVSIFVNPLQFSPDEDYDKYPRTLEADSDKLSNLNVNYVFAPNTNEFYKEKVLLQFDIPEMFNILCGKTRPGHFSGVCVVVAKLINVISPNKMYMGKKDYQQYMILKKMCTDLSFDAEVIGMPIIRGDEGLALSSRNKYLSEKEKFNALSINKSRKIAGDMYLSGADIIEIEKEITEYLIQNSLRVDYVEIRESSDLSKTKYLSDDSRVFIAAYCGKARLIDNFSIGECRLFSIDGNDISF